MHAAQLASEFARLLAPPMAEPVVAPKPVSSPGVQPGLDPWHKLCVDIRCVYQLMDGIQLSRFESKRDNPHCWR